MSPMSYGTNTGIWVLGSMAITKEVAKQKLTGSSRAKRAQEREADCGKALSRCCTLFHFAALPSENK
jgi:hypothetical protein